MSIQSFDTHDCNCSHNYDIVINESLPTFLLRPTWNGFYCGNMTCEWRIKLDTMNDTFMMKIYSDLFLNSNDFLSISTCDTQNIMFDSNVSTSNHNSFYTQEEEICIKFISSNNTEENNLFFWNVQFLLFPSPSMHKVIFYLSVN